MKVKIRILDKRLTEDKLPGYATKGSAAMDLRVLLDAPIIVSPGKCELLSTGLAIHIDNPKYAAMILPRSGMGHKRGLVLGNSMGLIDSDYQGELLISCWNRGSEPQEIQPFERIAQMLIVPVQQVDFSIVKEFEESTRGSGGYGHTGSD